MSLLISAIILAKNEERYIVECIKSLDFCDEILVINDNSTDRTIEAINKLDNKKVRVISHLLNENFSEARNFGLEKARNEWVLFIDADERVSEVLAFEVSSVVSNWTHGIENEYKGFYIRRVDFMWGKILKHGETGNAWRLRLARKTIGQWEGKVHERWKVKGLVGKLVNPIIHFPHGGNFEDFLKEINFYTSIRAKELFEKKAKVFFWSIILYPLGKFLINYYIKHGFMDGIQGLILAIMMSLHSFLFRGKLWLMWDKK